MSKLRQLMSRAVGAVRLRSGPDRPHRELPDVGIRVNHVQRWCEREFGVLKEDYERKLHEFELRMRHLEKSRAAFLMMTGPLSFAVVPSSFDVFDAPPAYFSRCGQLLQAVDTACGLFAARPFVLELYCGAAKSHVYLKDRVRQYSGFDPSPVLVKQAGRVCAHPGFSFELLPSRVPGPLGVEPADVVLLLLDESNWSVVHAAHLLRVAAASSTGGARVVFSSPHGFDDLRAAGWDLDRQLHAAGLQAEWKGEWRDASRHDWYCISRKRSPME